MESAVASRVLDSRVLVARDFRTSSCAGQAFACHVHRYLPASSFLGNALHTSKSHRSFSPQRLTCRQPHASSITEPTTATTVGYDDLIAFLASGCKPRTAFRIGTEHEKFGYDLKTLKPLPYEGGIKYLLENIRDRFDWQPIMENGYIIGLKQAGQSITLEPGGQFELSGAPLKTLHETCAEVNNHLYQVKAVCSEIGAGFLGVGFNPKWSIPDVPIMPKGRYKIMREYMPTVGTMGLDMMFRTCTVQVNLDFSSEQDMVDKMRVGLALQPVATALFANSPFKEGKPNGFMSYRSHVWTDVDNARCGDLPFVFEKGFDFTRYVDYMLDVPMYFVYRDGQYLNATGKSFRDFLNGKLSILPGERPTMTDWENHLTTAFPEVRLKRYIEMRGADSGPWKSICALPAFWVGLIYDEKSLSACLDLIADWKPEERAYLRANVRPSTTRISGLDAQT
eukprot:jgi/Mesvir1/4885/Mv11153-RA.2